MPGGIQFHTCPSSNRTAMPSSVASGSTSSVTTASLAHHHWQRQTEDTLFFAANQPEARLFCIAAGLDPAIRIELRSSASIQIGSSATLPSIFHLQLQVVDEQTQLMP
jgi:hypothetical protein